MNKLSLFNDNQMFISHFTMSSSLKNFKNWRNVFSIKLQMNLNVCRCIYEIIKAINKPRTVALVHIY